MAVLREKVFREWLAVLKMSLRKADANTQALYTGNGLMTKAVVVTSLGDNPLRRMQCARTPRKCEIGHIPGMKWIQLPIKLIF